MLLSLSERCERWTAAVVERPRSLFVLTALVLLIQIGPWWYASYDSVSYFSIARSVWHDEGWSLYGSPHLFYSLAYPLLLSPLFLISERPFFAVGVLHWLLALMLLVGVYRWARPLGNWTAVAVTALTLLHVQFGISYRRPLSETFFMTAMVWTVLACERFRQTDDRRERLLYGALGTLLLTLTCQIRPNGLMLIPGLGLSLLSAWGMRDRRRLLGAVAATALIGSIAVGTFFVTRQLDDRRAVGADAVTYWDYLTKLQDPTKASMWARIPDGIYIQMGDFQRLILPGMFKSRTNDGSRFNVNAVVAAAMTILVVSGWLLLVRRTGDMWAWSFPFFMGLNVLWAADAGTRYTLPVLPVIWATVCLAVDRYRPRLQRWLLPFIAVHAVVSLAHWASIELPRTIELNRHWNSVVALSANIDPRRDTAAVWNMSQEQHSLFNFQVDRILEPYDAAQPNRPTWIVTLTTQDVPIPAGYVLGPTAPPYRLFRRN